MATNSKFELPGRFPFERPLEIQNIYSMFRAIRPPNFYFAGECHTAWEMVFILDGAMGVSADDRIYTLNTGDVIFHKPMEFHRIWSTGEQNAEVFIFSFDLGGNMAGALRNAVLHLSDENRRVITNIVERFNNKIRVPFTYEGTEQNYKRYLEKTLGQHLIPAISELEGMLTSIAYSSEKALDAEKGENTALYTELTKLLEEHVYDWITIPEIAKACHVSPATVKKCFSAYAGTGVHKYLLKIKIRKAIGLLREGRSVSEVSDLLGFGNPNYFSFVFHRETGRAASSYKQR